MNKNSNKVNFTIDYGPTRSFLRRAKAAGRDDGQLPSILAILATQCLGIGTLVGQSGIFLIEVLKNDTIGICYDDDTVCGYILARRFRADRLCYISLVVVDEKYRRMGVCRKLIETVLMNMSRFIYVGFLTQNPILYATIEKYTIHLQPALNHTIDTKSVSLALSIMDTLEITRSINRETLVIENAFLGYRKIIPTVSDSEFRNWWKLILKIHDGDMSPHGVICIGKLGKKDL